ncbi:MAG: hypothetical protein N2491_11865 [Negativicutes bacterium]|nr:hypothetical protein [Negativicutes bacterium]
MRTGKLTGLAVIVLLSGSLLLGGCTNITPLDARPGYSLPAGPSAGAAALRVTYNFTGTDPVQLSANNIVLKVGQKLTLKPAPGFTGKVRFSSAGEHFWGDIMKQEANKQDSGQVTFTAQKPGKAKLKIIPNTDDVERAVDLWVTVE